MITTTIQAQRHTKVEDADTDIKKVYWKNRIIDRSETISRLVLTHNYWECSIAKGKVVVGSRWNEPTGSIQQRVYFEEDYGLDDRQQPRDRG